MQHIFKLAAVAALCASAVAHAGVAVDANIETNTDFRKKSATQDSVTNGGRVEVNFNAALAKNGDYFVNARGNTLINLSGGVSIDDAWLHMGGSTVDLKIGRFEAMDLFPLGKDVAPNITNIGYNANTLRGRFSDGRLHAALGINPSSALRVELGLSTEKQTGGASYGVRPVVQYSAGALTVRVGAESIKADGTSTSTSGTGVTLGYAVNSTTSVNVNFASNSKADKSAFGLNATFGDAGIGFVQGKNDATNTKSTSVYAAYSFPLLGVKGATITPAIGQTKVTGQASDTGARVRVNYAF
ncbi:MAG: hypothetical protein RLZZ352_2123 [Pseudomonadota bacterium]|jgi:hypothetical protein